MVLFISSAPAPLPSLRAGLIFQGELDTVFDNTLIGKLPIPLPEARESGYWQFEVTFKLDGNGLLRYVGDPHSNWNKPDEEQQDFLGPALDTVLAGKFTGCVRTKEWSMLEACTELKWYAKGVGIVKEIATAGDSVVLVSITKE